MTYDVYHCWVHQLVDLIITVGFINRINMFVKIVALSVLLIKAHYSDIGMRLVLSNNKESMNTLILALDNVKLRRISGSYSCSYAAEEFVGLFD